MASCQPLYFEIIFFLRIVVGYRSTFSLHVDICYIYLFCWVQVLVRNVPPDPDESVNELVEHFFLVNHPEHYFTHQV